MSTKAMMGVAVALTAILASPAFAATHHNTRNGYNAHARQVAPYEGTQTWRYSRNPSQSVYGTAGQYIGSDPDPLIRDQLARDPSQGGAILER